MNARQPLSVDLYANPRPMRLVCEVGSHAGHFAINILRRADGSTVACCTDHLGLAPLIGAPVRFAPNPRWPDRMIEGRILLHRDDRSQPGCRPSRIPGGWFDIIDEEGVVRSARPSRCLFLEKAPAGSPPAGAPISDAPAEAPAGVSVSRPIGPLAPGTPATLADRSMTP